MIHIKETEIIPLLKNAQAEYSQKITEGDPKDAGMAMAAVWNLIIISSREG